MKIFLKTLFMLAYLIFAQTEQQIKQAKEYIKKSGLTESQVKNAARARGYSEKQINNVLNANDSQAKKSELGQGNISPSQTQEYENQLGQEFLQSNNNVANEQNESSIKDIATKEEIEKDTHANSRNPISSPVSNADSMSYFGYDIFKRDPALFQASAVGAVDPDYLIGPGDEIIVMLWGETQFRQVLAVDREGFVFIPEIGQVFVNGLNLNLLESKLFRVLSQSYASLDPQNRKATTFLDVSLGNLRPLRIQVLGQVSQPGAYTVSPSSTLFSSLYYFNGPTYLGSLREIILIRNNSQIAVIDFYDYLLSGKKLEDQKLQLDDIVFIPKRLKTVYISGEINRPGVYELKPGETLKELLQISGGLKITAYTNRAQIDRIVPFEDRALLGMDRLIKDIDLSKIQDPNENIILQEGDRIKIFSILEQRQNIVELRGAVIRPGNYDIGDSLNLNELIKKANGFLGDAYLNRISLIRVNNDLSEEFVELNFNKDQFKEQASGIWLQGLDKIRVYGMNEMKPPTFVSITGHVKRPGSYLLRKNMTIYDLLFDSGGIIDELFTARTYLDRADLVRFAPNRISKEIIPFDLNDILENKNSEQNIPLQAGDLIRIYDKTINESVRPIYIDGAINNPGEYELKVGMTVEDLILEAGGVSIPLETYKVEVARMNLKGDKELVYREIDYLDMYNDFSIDKSGKAKESSTPNQLSNNTHYKLMPFDQVFVRANSNATMQKNVTISGEVFYPGTYPIISSKEKITNIIQRAGGLKPTAYAVGSRFTRNNQSIQIDIEKIIKKPNSRMNIGVQENDNIFISKKPNLIQVLGEVSSPGFYSFVKNYRINDVIDEAGGFSQDAEKNDIYIEYPNGKSKQYRRWFSNPKVLDGSIIRVGAKKEEEPFDRTEYAKEITSIFANLAQAISLIILAKS